VVFKKRRREEKSVLMRGAGVVQLPLTRWCWISFMLLDVGGPRFKVTAEDAEFRRVF
jgi:hypothetical protein